MLEIKDLSHRLGRMTVVNQVNLAVPQGSIFALLGPNGCGKSTLFRIVLGLLPLQQGSVSFMGSTDAEVYRRQIGVLLDQPDFLDNQTGLQQLQWISLLKQVPLQQALQLAERLEIAPALNRRVGTYSLGMKKRLGMVAALLGTPRLLLLDEPSNGLDPLHLVALRQVLLDYVAAGGTVLFSSHMMSEVERMCTHLALMSQGQIIDQGLRQNMLQDHQSIEDLFIARTRASQF